VAFEHWLHRALFLTDIEHAEGISRYALTRLRRRRPYLLYLFYRQPQEETLLRSAGKHTHGVTDSSDATRTLAALAKLVFHQEVVYLGGPDVLLDGLHGGTRFFWKSSYCDLCGDRECRRASTQTVRCQRISEEIGALDDVEIDDILKMYRRPAESLLSCYTRLAEMSGLRDVLESARPRWPEAFR